MRAIVVRRVGGPEVLELEDALEPVPGAGQLLVAVRAAGVNYMDSRQRRAIGPRVPLPFTPGVEGAGRVLAVGEGVADITVGDRVAWSMAPGSYAQQVVVEANRAVPVPDDLSEEAAAAALLQGLTAHHLLSLTRHVRDDGVALVQAAAGGVGLLLTQMLTRRGHRVVGVVSSVAKADVARRAGAAEVIVARGADIAGEVMRLTEGEGVDIAYDGVGRDTFATSLAALKLQGVLAYFGEASGPVEPLDPFTLPKSILLTKPVVLDHVNTPGHLREHAAELFRWLADGELFVHIDKRFDLAEAARAHAELESRRSSGKLLLLPQ
jgi:NADPH:quinone reductase